MGVQGVPVLNARGSPAFGAHPSYVAGRPSVCVSPQWGSRCLWARSACAFSAGDLEVHSVTDAAAGSWIPWCMGEDGVPRFMSAGSQNVTSLGNGVFADVIWSR